MPSSFGHDDVTDSGVRYIRYGNIEPQLLQRGNDPSVFQEIRNLVFDWGVEREMFMNKFYFIKALESNLELYGANYVDQEAAIHKLWFRIRNSQIVDFGEFADDPPYNTPYTPLA